MKALILVDLQNDFMPGGPLAVSEGDSVVPVANFLATKFDTVIATQDWHPADHGSFASNHKDRNPGDVIKLDNLDQVLWPNHCIQGTHGAEFHHDLKRNLITQVFQKGEDKSVDSYSGFFDNNKINDTGLHDWLQKKEVKHLYIMGLATDYCVKYTAIDAAKLGYSTFLIEDGCKGVELKKGDVAAAISEMREAGVKIVSTREIQISGRSANPPQNSFQTSA